jgi:hypothetical protein
MKNICITLMLIVVVTAGCTSMNVRPVDSAIKPSHICIKENPLVRVDDLVQVVKMVWIDTASRARSFLIRYRRHANISLRIPRHENIYYRRYRYEGQVRSPARILWYVTKSQHQKNSMQLKACSALDEIIIGKAKDLFRNFQRLGIYEWTDIMRDTSNNPNHSLMALRFNNSEIFRYPIGLQSFLETVKREDGKSLCLQSPQTISAKSFAILYSKGMGII